MGCSREEAAWDMLVVVILKESWWIPQMIGWTLTFTRELLAVFDCNPCHRRDSGLVMVGQEEGGDWLGSSSLSRRAFDTLLSYKVLSVYSSLVVCQAISFQQRDIAGCLLLWWHYAFKLPVHSSQSGEQAFKEQFKFWLKSLTKSQRTAWPGKNLISALTQESILWQSFMQMYPRIKCWGDDILSSKFKGELFRKYWILVLDSDI